MTAVKTMNGTKLLIQIGDGGSPETFTHDCLINAERSIQFSSDTNDIVVPDCDNPDSPAWKEVVVDGLQATVSGAGMLHTASVADWFAWFISGQSKNIRVNNNVATGVGGGYWAAAFMLTAFEETGARNDKATVSVTLASTGVVTWVPAA